MKTNRIIFNINVVFTLIISMSVFSGCNQQSKQLTNDKKGELQDAQWITDTREWPANDIDMYGNLPAPLFRKEFNIKEEIKSATLYITAAGYYSASINGEKIGKNYLDPAWTDYSKRIYYSEYDLTAEIDQGLNCIGLTLGNGFYNPLPMRMWGTYNLRESLSIGNPSSIARLKIEYKNGSTEEVITDKSWKHSFGPILKNNIYLGEVYDAGKEVDGWDKTGFDDSKWNNSIENRGPGGQLKKAFFPPIQETNRHKPIAITSPENGTFITDMGVNFTGLYRIRLKGQRGDTITFRFGERIYDNGTLNPMTAVCGQIKKKGIGGPGSPDIAWQTDQYIFGDKTDVWYSPLFTYHVYRYMEISGLAYKPEKTDIEGIAFNTNVETTNSFSSSSGLINSIQDITERTFLDNLISVQSDCPAREKFGYGGDLNATSESFIYNFDMQSFYRKTLYDWVDVLSDTMFVDTAPYVNLAYCGISWESAFIITQYQLLLYYNDIDLIKELYELDLEWMDKVARLHPSGIVDKGLADHESLETVPVELIGTTHYLACARIMRKFASLMNDKVNEKRFEDLANTLSDNVLDMFWRKPLADPINRQTLFATLLYYNIIPEDEIKAATDSLLKAVKQGPSGHFTTGIFGTKYILEALSITGNSNTAFNIANNTSYPGWGFMISRGATTLWETWKESEDVYSNCHPMFGSVSEWFYRWLGGIRPDPEFPGFRKFVIAPSLPDDLKFVKCSYKSPFGIIKSNWEKSKEGLRFEISVPQATSATFTIPAVKNSTIIIENLDTDKIVSHKVSKTLFELELTEGNYSIRCK